MQLLKIKVSEESKVDNWSLGVPLYLLHKAIRTLLTTEAMIEYNKAKKLQLEGFEDGLKTRCDWFGKVKRRNTWGSMGANV
jgi:hypothetical protein